MLYSVDDLPSTTQLRLLMVHRYGGKKVSHPVTVLSLKRLERSGLVTFNGDGWDCTVKGHEWARKLELQE